MAAALAAGIWADEFWFTELLVLVAMGQGMVAGATWDDFWREDAATEIFGAGGRYAGFLAAVAFAAVEAYAVGKGMSRGAPALVALLLAPPVVVAGVALNSAVRRRDGGRRGDADEHSERSRREHGERVE